MEDKMSNMMEQQNDTVTQSDDNVGDQLETEYTSLVFQVAVGVSLYSLALLTCVGNAMVIHAIRTEKRLKTVSNLFIMSLAVADLVVGAFVMPISAIYALTNRWYLGKWLCEAWLSVDYTASTASIFNLFVLSADRYWSIMSPLKYLRQRTKRRALVLITAAWLLSSLWILPVTTWHRITNQGVRLQPDNVCDTEFAHNVPFKVTAAVVNFYIPTLAMLYIYGRIFRTIRLRSRSHLGEVSCSGSGAANGVRNTPRLPNSSERDKLSPPVCDTNGFHATSVSSSAAQQQQQQQRLKNAVDESSDTFSLDTNSRRGTNSSGLEHFKLRRVLNSWCRKPCQIKPKSDETLTVDDGPKNSLYGGLYQSLTLLEVGDAGNKLSVKKLSVTSTTHFVNVQVNVEYVPDEEPVGAERTADPVKRVNSQESRGACSKSKLSVGSTGSTALISQKERKAARQLGVIMCAFIMCWLPYFIVFLVVAVCPSCISGTLQNITLWLGYANSTLNPFLYPLCNANFRLAFSRMIRRGSRLSWAKNQTEYAHKETSCQNRY